MCAYFAYLYKNETCWQYEKINGAMFLTDSSSTQIQLQTFILLFVKFITAVVIIFLLTLRRYVVLSNVILGEIDQKTQELMAKPRCGVADNVASMDDGTIVGEDSAVEAARRKRYVIQKSVEYGQKWKRKDLKYRITKYSQKIPSSVVDGVIRKAFWVNSVILHA